MNTPQSTNALLDTTIQTLTNGEHATKSGQALIDDWLNELAHYEGLGPVQEALKSLQGALLNEADPAQVRVLLMELAEYTQAFARQPTTLQRLADALQRLADALQSLSASNDEVGHS